MPGVYKRASDKARGKLGRWTAWWTDEHGKTRSRAAYTDKPMSLQLACARETECRGIRDGLIDPAEAARRGAARRPLSEHVAEYGDYLRAKGDGEKHAKQIASALERLFAGGGVSTFAEMRLSRLQGCLGRMRQAGKSARTCNHALGAVKAFASWLEADGRIDRVPRGLAKLARYNEQADQRYVRRALTDAEIDRLLAAAQAGVDIEVRRGPRDRLRVAGSRAFLTGPERAALYRLAMGTGFRAEELRTLTPERFALDGDEPTITVLACYAKSGKRVVQPITRELAAEFRPFLAGKAPGKPVLNVPEKTAKLLRHDLKNADIPYADAEGRVVDFHALRASYITHLEASGVNPKILQALARHSDIRLTMDRYVKVRDEDIRKALEGAEFQAAVKAPKPAAATEVTP